LAECGQRRWIVVVKELLCDVKSQSSRDRFVIVYA